MTVEPPFVLAPQTADLEETAPLRRLLDEAKTFARPQVSDFRVGALALGESGKLYRGCNLEFEGLDFSYTVHAEQFALAMAHLAEEPAIKAMFVSTMPCGHCRQFLMELGHSELPVVVVDEKGRMDVSLKDLLLFPFTLAEHQHLLTPHSAALILREPHADALVNAAVKMADRSYVPYTQSHAGVALELPNGRVVSGCSLESAAFNPTLSPLLMALCQLVAYEMPFESIKRACLVQRQGPPVSYEAHVARWLQAVAPQAEFQTETVVIARL